MSQLCLNSDLNRAWGSLAVCLCLDVLISMFRFWPKLRCCVLCAVRVGATDLLSLRVWNREPLDRIADCNLLRSANLGFVSKRVCLRSSYGVSAATAGACCFILPN
ncbi:hypothetical protein TETAUR1b_000045 [Candidatus Hodgkinia cicadicola]|nr:hypothetical protein TETAUR1b_000045 [Candidatus Hodgkinia cicadicola]